MFTRRTLLAVAACAALSPLAAPGWAAGEDLPAEGFKFVAGIVDQALKILKDKSLGEDEQIKRLTDLFIENFDVRAMSLFALGVYAGRARGAEREAYFDAFKNYMIRHYFSRLESVGDVFSINRAALDGENIVWVTSQAGSRGEKGYRVEWRVRKQDGLLKIFDVLVEGSSLMWLQRNDFASVLRHNDGNIAELTRLMRIQKVGSETPSQ
ncbi:MAG TPA: ABC transporter substrate-binding protein [Alphaproteobacteria bacterium]|nr:ABC transporter substrate-binding protein [Alphaproteobacteria bacterium]